MWCYCSAVSFMYSCVLHVSQYIGFTWLSKWNNSSAPCGLCSGCRLSITTPVVVGSNFVRLSNRLWLPWRNRPQWSAALKNLIEVLASSSRRALPLPVRRTSLLFLRGATSGRKTSAVAPNSYQGEKPVTATAVCHRSGLEIALHLSTLALTGQPRVETSVTARVVWHRSGLEIALHLSTLALTGQPRVETSVTARVVWHRSGLEIALHLSTLALTGQPRVETSVTARVVWHRSGLEIALHLSTLALTGQPRGCLVSNTMRSAASVGSRGETQAQQNWPCTFTPSPIRCAAPHTPRPSLYFILWCTDVYLVVGVVFVCLFVVSFPGTGISLRRYHA